MSTQSPAQPRIQAAYLNLHGLVVTVSREAAHATARHYEPANQRRILWPPTHELVCLVCIGYMHWLRTQDPESPYVAARTILRQAGQEELMHSITL